MAILSCGKQSADLDNSLVSSYDGKTTNSSCKNLDLSKNLLKKQSILKIFDCIGWKSEFPSLYSYLKNLNHKEFELIFDPLNNAFFADIKKRNELLIFIQNKVSKSEIHHLSREIKSILNDDVLINIFSKISQDYNFELPSKKLVTSSINLLNEVSKANNKKKKVVKSSLNKFEETSYRKQILNDFKLSIIDQAVSYDSNFLLHANNFILPTPWPVKFFNKYSTEEISALLAYATKQKKLNDDLAIVQTTISLNLNDCHEFNSVFQLDYQVELDERLRTLATTNKVTFLMDMFELSQRFSLFNNICPYENFNKTSSRVLSHMRSYATMPGGYEFLKALANISIMEDDLYLIFNMAQSESFKLLGKSTIADQKADTFLLDSIHNLLIDYDSNLYEKLSSTLLLANNEVNRGHLEPLKDLSDLEKVHLSDLLIKDIILDDSLLFSTNLLSKFMAKYGSLYTEYKKGFSENKIDYALWIFTLNSKLKDKAFKDELIKFLNSDVFFKLVSFISREKTLFEKTESDMNEILVERKDEVSTLKEESELIQCLQEFNEVSSVDYDFWHLLENYPKVCIELVTEKSLASHIFQWTIDIDNVFSKEVNDKFSYSYGMIAPEMMSFYHSLMHIINTHLNKNKGYISDVVSNIRQELFEKGLVEVLETSILTMDQLVEKTTLLDKALNKMTRANPKTFDETFKAMLRPISYQNKVVQTPNYDCKSANPNIGGNTCFSQDELESFLLDISNLLIRDNGSKRRLYESLVEFLFGEVGIQIPFDSKKQRSKKLDLDELARFLFDMTDEKTNKKITFRTKDTKREFSANRAERLEIVIREISFLNNFYGAFFMNSVSRAKKYYKKVKSMQKYVGVMDGTEGFFRRRRLFPEETSWAFNNILETYSSLYELETKHKQPDGGYKRYGDFIQTILSMAVETSSYQSQKYTPFQTPKPGLVKKHNGMFITRITELSFLNQMGLWLRKISGNDLISIVENKNFKLINKNIGKLLSTKKAKELFEFVLSNRNRKLIIRDLTNFIHNVKKEDSSKVSNILWNFLTIITKGSSPYEGDKLVPLIKMIVENYHIVRDYNLLSLDSFTINEIAEYFSKVEQLPVADLRMLIKASFDLIEIADISELDRLLQDKDFIDTVSKVKLALLNYLKKPDYNTGFLYALLEDHQLSFTPLQKMLIKTYDAQGDFDYIKNIIKVLSLNTNSKSNIEIALREIFEEKDVVVIKFLTDMFNKFSRPSIQ